MHVVHSGAVHLAACRAGDGWGMQGRMQELVPVGEYDWHATVRGQLPACQKGMQRQPGKTTPTPQGQRLLTHDWRPHLEPLHKARPHLWYTTAVQ